MDGPFSFSLKLPLGRLELSSVAVSENVRWTFEQDTGRRRLRRSQGRRDFEEIPLKSAQQHKKFVQGRRDFEEIPLKSAGQHKKFVQGRRDFEEIPLKSAGQLQRHEYNQKPPESILTKDEV